jgi:large subunit ribosomal protein L23
MRAAQDIILRPIITERTIEGVANRKYTFKVARDANRIEIAQAAKVLFGVEVQKVNTMNCKGRAKRVGRHAGYKPNWKKAIVTLTENSKGIEFFESMV